MSFYSFILKSIIISSRLFHLIFITVIIPFNPRFNYADTSASNLKDKEIITPFNLSSDDYKTIKDIIAYYLIANNLLTVSLKDKGLLKLLNSLYPAIITDIESKLGATTFTGVPPAYVLF